MFFILTNIDVKDILIEQINLTERGHDLDNKHKEHAKVFKAFCDENRLNILEILQEGERCACELLEELHIGQSTLSHHMKILCEAQVVTGRKEGKWTHYSINQEGQQKATQLLEAISKLKTASGTQTSHTCEK